MTSRYSIVGLGRVGASMAAAIARRGFEVVGVDIDTATVDAINEGRAPTEETGLADTIRDYHQRLRATTDCADAILHSDATFVVVPTPTERDGAYSVDHVRAAFGDIGRALRQKDGYHLVVLTSTVLPGSARNALTSSLEAASGKRCGPEFGFCYSPILIALGSVMRDFLNPSFAMVGEFDERSGAELEAHYARILENQAVSKRMSVENAEVLKLAINSFLTTKITFANMVADICELLPGGDVDTVLGAMGLDPRIGHRYLTGGLGFGGPCLPRDNSALSALGKQLGVDTSLGATTDSLNRDRAARVAARVRREVPPGATAAILGLAYKPDTSVVEESQGIAIARALADGGLRVVGYDPLVCQTAAETLGEAMVVTDDLEACLQQSDAVVIASPDPAFARLKASDFPKRQKPVVVFDAWRLLKDELASAEHVQYLGLGLGKPR